LASSLAVYSNAGPGPWHEDIALPVASDSHTAAIKKAMEVLALHYADRTGLDAVVLRLGVIYGPLYHSMANLPSRLCHAAVAVPEAGGWTSRASARMPATRPRTMSSAESPTTCAGCSTPADTAAGAGAGPRWPRTDERRDLPVDRWRRCSRSKKPVGHPAGPS